MRIIDVRGNLSAQEIERALPRAELDIARALESVAPIIESVRADGAKALLDLADRFDGVRPDHLRVPQEAIDAAEAELDPELRNALMVSIEHNRKGHEAQLPQERDTQIVDGGWVTQRWIPVRRVGLYVPGGLAVYPSSVVHNAVAAQVAGVEQIALASPPQKEFGGLPHPTILAACKLLGITEVYAVGGAQAIAMFAYGCEAQVQGEQLCERVDVVTGPGNIYVAAAKRAVHGVVGTDGEAGTTEIAIIADDVAEPVFVAADLVSQAEHDPAAASVLITHSEEVAAHVVREVERLARNTKHATRVKIALEGSQSGVVLTESLAHSIDVANLYGAEHLEIQTIRPHEVSRLIRNAGAIFVGPCSPVPLGDYLAGSNHVLPTGGTARFSSGLGVHAFIKSVQEITYTRQALAHLYEPLAALARAENLPAHAEALAVRLDEDFDDSWHWNP